ncbi:MAG: FkbM family methyltransferase [Planctomycetaceae bacterium]
MRTAAKNIARSLFETLGYRVTRHRPQNRFLADDEALALLHAQGYRPRLIVDGGANVGDWTRKARRIFPEAQVHLFEPQTGCEAPLRELSKSSPGLFFHPFALTRPGVASVRMGGGGGDDRGTGCYVARSPVDDTELRERPARSLDEVVAGLASPSDRVLLKLDLQGHELDALAGACRLLDSVEVVLSEVSFYPVGGDGPVFFDYASFLRDRGFEMYDVAGLFARTRDQRLRQGDILFVKRTSPLYCDYSWE